MMHSCPDGTYSKLIRTGPIGTMVGVTYDCPRCGYHRSAKVIWDAANTARPVIAAALKNR